MNEFLCGHFNIEDGRQHTTLSAYYYFKKGKNATETQKKTWATYGEGVVADHMLKVVCELLRWRYLTGPCSMTGQTS